MSVRERTHFESPRDANLPAAIAACGGSAVRRGTMRVLLVLLGHLHVILAAPSPWSEWLVNFGHDDYVYPRWITNQMEDGRCQPTHDEARDAWTSVCSAAGEAPGAVTFCSAKQFLLDHMPEFDKTYLPPSVSVSESLVPRASS